VPRTWLTVVIPPPAVPDIPWVEEIKLLGEMLSSSLSVVQHFDYITPGCLSTVTIRLRTLPYHGLPASAMHTVFQATVVAKLMYASPTR